MTVKIFFPAAAGDILLSAEEQTIFRSSDVANRARQILQRLLDGPKSNGLLPAVPKDTKVQAVFIDESGLAFVDFSNALNANHNGGILNEQSTVYSIVNSLTYNLPEIHQVKILIGGAERETLAGHCLLLPLGMDLSVANVGPPKREP